MLSFKALIRQVAGNLRREKLSLFANVQGLDLVFKIFLNLNFPTLKNMQNFDHGTARERL